jgi:predicted O-methyltransferase YrrM
MAKDRGDWLVELLKDKPHAAGAEIGVRAGETSLKLLDGLPGLVKFYAVDPWEEYEDYRKAEGVNQDWLTQVFGQALERMRPHMHRVWPLRAYSVDAAHCVPDASLDFVFIDACHEYEYVSADIQAWYPKVKPGGLVSGHDYSWHPIGRAVGECLDAHGNPPMGYYDDDVWAFWKPMEEPHA